MADFSIDQNRLPGVKEVCRDFAVLEDHTLAHSLQEQEIENHLASNIHKSRLVQQDLQVAKRLQEEEDLRAKARIQRWHKDIERSDNEIAQEIQEQLVRQAEKQRQQEEKDEAIARKLQEKEMKEERRRQKQLEANFEEECYDEKGASKPPQDSIKGRHPERGPSEPTGGEHHECYTMGCSKSRYPKYYLPESGQGNYTKNSTVEPKMGRNHDFHSSDSSRGRDPEIVSAKRRKEWPHHSQESPVEAQGSQFSIYTSREEHRGRPTSHELDKAVHWRERPARSCVPQHIWERDKERKRWRHKEGYSKQARDRKGEWERDRERDWEKGKGRTGGKSREQHRDGYGDKGRDDHKNWEFWDTDRAKDGDLDDARPSTSKVWLAEEIPNWDNLGGRLKWQPWDGEVFEDYSPITSKRGDREEPRAPRKEVPRARSHLGEDVPSPSYLPREKGKMTRGEYGMREATQGIARLDLREQELRDLEVARRLQEEELKASQMDKRAAQVAQDEEIARLLMEEEKKVYKRSRDREKPVMDKKRPEGDWKPGPEEVVRPRSQEEYNYQRPRNHKPDREPLHTHDYENMDSSYQYPTSHYSPRSSPGPETTCKGSYYRQ